MPYRINTKNLKTGWKRSESELSFRQWCKKNGMQMAWDLAGILKVKYGEEWLKMEQLRPTYRVITEKAGKLTGTS